MDEHKLETLTVPAGHELETWTETLCDFTWEHVHMEGTMRLWKADRGAEVTFTVYVLGWTSYNRLRVIVGNGDVEARFKPEEIRALVINSCDCELDTSSLQH